MTRCERALAVLTVLASSGCATTNYQFPNDHSRQCFVPCKTRYYGCSAHCSSSYYDYHHHHRRADTVDAVFGLIDAAASVGCEASCASQLDSCAARCGATNVNRPQPVTRALPPPPKRSVALTGAARQEVLQAHGGEARTETFCAALWGRIEHLARNTEDGEPPQSCVGEDDFVATCKRLLPPVAQCLNPEIMRRAPERCRGWMKREDPQIAAAMNTTLQACYPRPTAIQPAPPTSQPASQPAASQPPDPVEQLGDVEEP